MSNLLDRPKMVYPVLAVLLVALFGLSAVGNTDDSHKATHGVSYWIGSIGWFGFLVVLLAIIVYSVVQVARLARRRRASVSQS
jgi:ABC-type dipeptide/oligopeptide/nickel transport system permease subunit